MALDEATDRYTRLPDEETLAGTIVSLEQRGFSVDVVDDVDAAREAVLARIPHGSLVLTNTSETLRETGIVEAVDGAGGPYDSARAKMLALDRVTQRREMKAIARDAEFSLGSVQAVTSDGILVLASATGSQISAHAYNADQVILVVGAQKLVPDLAAAHERVFQHCLPLEDARALAAYRVHSRVGKILEIHDEDPGRIHIVLIRTAAGF